MTKYQNVKRSLTLSDPRKTVRMNRFSFVSKPQNPILATILASSEPSKPVRSSYFRFLTSYKIYIKKNRNNSSKNKRAKELFLISCFANRREQQEQIYRIKFTNLQPDREFKAFLLLTNYQQIFSHVYLRNLYNTTNKKQEINGNRK